MAHLFEAVCIMVFPYVTAEKYIDIISFAQDRHMDIHEDNFSHGVIYFYDQHDVQPMRIFLSQHGIFVKMFNLAGPCDM